METKVYSINGEQVRTIVLNDDVFNREVSDGSICTAAVNNELANRRVRTACTKTRGEVNYSNTKPYKQRETGNARAGDKKSPIWVGGGTISDPNPRLQLYDSQEGQALGDEEPSLALCAGGEVGCCRELHH